MPTSRHNPQLQLVLVPASAGWPTAGTMYHQGFFVTSLLDSLLDRAAAAPPSLALLLSSSTCKRMYHNRVIDILAAPNDISF